MKYIETRKQQFKYIETSLKDWYKQSQNSGIYCTY